MNLRFLSLVLSFLSICSAAEYPPPPVYPVASSGPEFEKEAEAFVIAKSVHLSGLENKEQFINDPRDWEPVLEKLIREPSVHGITVSNVAFGYTAYRGTAKNPEIVAATGEWFNRHVQEALKRYEKYSGEGNPTHPGVYGSMPNIIGGILKVGAPAHLTHVLDYLNSPADEKIRLIARNTPRDVAGALQTYGNENHIEAAEKFAQRLRGEGKGDIADDIARSVERIKKDAGRKQGTSTGRTGESSNDASAPDGESTKSASKKPLWPWLAAGGALLAAVIGYFRMKRAGA